MVTTNRGDTIVEVMFSFVIFSLVAVGIISVMNQGVAMAERSLEISLVRQQIDSQAGLLRYIRDDKNDGVTGLWTTVKARATTSIASFSNQASCPTTTSIPSNAFIIQPTSSQVNVITLGAGSFEPASTYSKIDYTVPSPKSYGLWIQATEVDSSSTLKAYDFHIQACWYSVGTNVPMTIGTIVRLYDK